jgi:hypothetical protein
MLPFTLNMKTGKLGKEDFMACFVLLSQHLCGVTKENHKTLNSANRQPARKLLNLGEYLSMKQECQLCYFIATVNELYISNDFCR